VNEESYEAKFPQITEFIEHWRSNGSELVDRVISDRILKCSLEGLTKRNGVSCPFSNIHNVSVGMILERIIIIIIIIIIIMSFMQGIYTYIPETNYVPKEYSVSAILLLLFMVLISLVSVVNLLYFYISTFGSNYGLDGPGSNPGGDEIFCLSRPALGPTQPPVEWVPGLSRG